MPKFYIIDMENWIVTTTNDRGLAQQFEDESSDHLVIDVDANAVLRAAQKLREADAGDLPGAEGDGEDYPF